MTADDEGVLVGSRVLICDRDQKRSASVRQRWTKARYNYAAVQQNSKFSGLRAPDLNPREASNEFAVGRTWWAHLKFIPISIKLTISKNQIEDLRIVGGSCVSRLVSVSGSRRKRQSVPKQCLCVGRGCEPICAHPSCSAMLFADPRSSILEATVCRSIRWNATFRVNVTSAC